jgi:hypothetical protein
MHLYCNIYILDISLVTNMLLSVKSSQVYYSITGVIDDLVTIV